MGINLAKQLGAGVLLVLGTQPGLAMDSCPTDTFDLRGEWYSPIPGNDRPGNRTLFQLTLPSIATGSVGCYWADHIAGGYPAEEGEVYDAWIRGTSGVEDYIAVVIAQPGSIVNDIGSGRSGVAYDDVVFHITVSTDGLTNDYFSQAHKGALPGRPGRMRTGNPE